MTGWAARGSWIPNSPAPWLGATAVRKLLASGRDGAEALRPLLADSRPLLTTATDPKQTVDIHSIDGSNSAGVSRLARATLRLATDRP